MPQYVGRTLVGLASATLLYRLATRQHSSPAPQPTPLPEPEPLQPIVLEPLPLETPPLSLESPFDDTFEPEVVEPLLTQVPDPEPQPELPAPSLSEPPAVRVEVRGYGRQVQDFVLDIYKSRRTSWS